MGLSGYYLWIIYGLMDKARNICITQSTFTSTRITTINNNRTREISTVGLPGSKRKGPFTRNDDHTDIAVILLYLSLEQKLVGPVGEIVPVSTNKKLCHLF